MGFEKIACKFGELWRRPSPTSSIKCVRVMTGYGTGVELPLALRGQAQRECVLRPD